MAFRPTFVLPRADNKSLRALMAALVLIDEDELRRGGGRIPALYRAGVHYRRDPAGVEDWCPISTLQRRGWGDCKSLVAWRIAELRHRYGETRAQPLWSRECDGRGCLFHLVVRRASGRIECPSTLLGMKV